MPAAAGVASRPSAWRWLAATRPAFLSLTLLGWLIGVAASHPPAALRGGLLLALLGAVLLHALANVVNDVADDANGGDAVNTGRVFPFTGGSRLIQDGVLSARAMTGLAVALGVVLLGLGGLLLWWRGWPVAVLGGAGFLVAWGYSAPPLALNRRGLGEPAVALAFALVPWGTAWLVAWPSEPLGLAALAYALAVAAVLYVNQFPDREADLACGKRHWVARWTPQQAARRFGFLLAGLYAVAALVVPAADGPLWLLPVLLLPLVLHATAWRMLLRDAVQPVRLAPAIRFNLLAVHGVALWLAGALYGF